MTRKSRLMAMFAMCFMPSPTNALELACAALPLVG